MKRLCLILLVLVCLVLVCCQGKQKRKPLSPEECKQKRAVIQSYRQALSEEGLYAFCAQTNVVRKVPYMYSYAYVERQLATRPDEQAYAFVAHDFGKDCMYALGDYAMKVLEPAASDICAQQADELLTIAAWLSQEPGYGNFSMKRWAEDIACIPIGRLVIDLDYPVAQIEALLARIDGDKENLRIQIDILNSESPDRYYKPLAKDHGLAAKSLARQWSWHYQKVHKYFKQYESPRSFYYSVSKDDPWEYAFYKDVANVQFSRYEDYLWQDKQHYGACVNGWFYDRMFDRVSKLLMFRKTIGHFPQKPKCPGSCSFGSQQEQAFDEAWRPYWNTLGINDAGFIYSLIISNEFMDYRTEWLREHRQNAMRNNLMQDEARESGEH